MLVSEVSLYYDPRSKKHQITLFGMQVIFNVVTGTESYVETFFCVVICKADAFRITKTEIQCMS